MTDIGKIRNNGGKTLTIGSYPTIIQSILDFDFLSGKSKPSVIGIIATGRKFERYFFGTKEVLVPVFHSVDDLNSEDKKQVSFFLNLTSARRILSSTTEIFEKIPNILGGVIFAENVPEKHSIQLYELSQKLNKFIVGPSSVGLVMPSFLKLGAIGGIDISQLIDLNLFTKGNIAIFSSSGGIIGELIRIIAKTGKNISFALSFGGDRFPILTPKDAFILAQEDSQTESIVYFGELGGNDEYEIADLIKAKLVTKKVICFIAGN